MSLSNHSFRMAVSSSKAEQLEKLKAVSQVRRLNKFVDDILVVNRKRLREESKAAPDESTALMHGMDALKFYYDVEGPKYGKVMTKYFTEKEFMQEAFKLVELFNKSGYHFEQVWDQYMIWEQRFGVIIVNGTTHQWIVIDKEKKDPKNQFRIRTLHGRQAINQQPRPLHEPKWTFPKGKRDYVGESEIACARRHAMEKAGLNIPGEDFDPKNYMILWPHGDMRPVKLFLVMGVISLPRPRNALRQKYDDLNLRTIEDTYFFENIIQANWMNVVEFFEPEFVTYRNARTTKLLSLAMNEPGIKQLYSRAKSYIPPICPGEMLRLAEMGKKKKNIRYRKPGHDGNYYSY